MAFTKVLGPGIHTLSNITSHNIHSSGIVTAVSFVGDGSGLTGVASTDSIITGTAATFNTYPVDINAGMTVAGVSSFSGALSGTTANFSGDVTVGGVLTYEDVKNVDSVGLITARNGINVSGGNIVVGTGVTIESNGNATFAGIITSSSDIDLISNDAQLLLEYPGRTRAHITANYYNRLTIATNNFTDDISFGYTQYPGNSSTFSNPPRTIFYMDMGEESFKVSKYGVGYGVTLNGSGNATFTGIVTATAFKLANGSDVGTGAGGTWSTYTAGIATSKSVGVNTSNLDDNDLVGVGNSFQGLYISNGMLIHDNSLNGNHYIGTSMNGLMAGPVNIEGTLTIDGNYVVV